MSQLPPPPPSPYDGQPAPANPYGPSETHPPGPAAPYPPGPAAPYPPGPASPRPGMTNNAKFWIGFALSLPANFIAVMISGAVAAAGDAIAPNTEVGGVISGILGLAILAGLVVGITVERTRWFALGILAGTIVMGILAAIAIMLFLIALTGSL